MIAAGLCTWQDGPALEACLASIEGHVDHVFMADGAFEGIDTGELAPGPRWANLGAKRNALFQQAKAAGYTWLLALDSDEVLHNGHLLRQNLAGFPYAVYPIPMVMELGLSENPDADGSLSELTNPWKLVRLDCWTEHLAQSYFMRDTNEQNWNLCYSPPHSIEEDWGVSGAREFRTKLPYLEHRPHTRPSGFRQTVRMAQLETVQEPSWPADTRMLVHWYDLLASNGKGGQMTFQCPACGEIYDHAGICHNQHEREVLVAWPEADPVSDADVAADPVADADVAADPVAADPVAAGGKATVTLTDAPEGVTVSGGN